MPDGSRPPDQRDNPISAPGNSHDEAPASGPEGVPKPDTGRAGAPEDRRSFFGMKQSVLPQARAANPFDYEQKYDEDEYCKEMAPNARFWRVYLDEGHIYDTEMIEGWRDTLDVLLVFAGLFSAVVTTLVVQSSTALKPDYAQISASLMIELIGIQRALAKGSEIDAVSPSALGIDTLTASALDYWCNAFWFISLTLSLSAALMAVLVKQWLQAYKSNTFGTPKHQALVRQFRLAGIERWNVPLIVGLLPMVLHLALLLFFVGLTLFIFTLSSAIASVVIALAIIIYSVYLATNILPMREPGCPYKTPLSHYGYIAVRYVATHTAEARPLSWLRKTWQTIAKFRLPISRQDTAAEHPTEPPTARADSAPSDWTTRHRETEAIKEHEDSLVVDCITWLYSASSNPTVSSITVQAVAGLSVLSISILRSQQRHCKSISESLFARLQSLSWTSDDQKEKYRSLEERLMRSLLFVDEQNLTVYNTSVRRDWFYDIPWFVQRVDDSSSIGNSSMLTSYWVLCSKSKDLPDVYDSDRSVRYTQSHILDLRLHPLVWTRALDSLRLILWFDLYRLGLGPRLVFNLARATLALSSTDSMDSQAITLGAALSSSSADLRSFLEGLSKLLNHKYDCDDCLNAMYPFNSQLLDQILAKWLEVSRMQWLSDPDWRAAEQFMLFTHQCIAKTRRHACDLYPIVTATLPGLLPSDIAPLTGLRRYKELFDPTSLRKLLLYLANPFQTQPGMEWESRPPPPRGDGARSSRYDMDWYLLFRNSLLSWIPLLAHDLLLDVLQGDLLAHIGPHALRLLKHSMSLSSGVSYFLTRYLEDLTEFFHGKKKLANGTSLSKEEMQRHIDYVFSQPLDAPLRHISWIVAVHIYVGSYLSKQREPLLDLARQTAKSHALVWSEILSDLANDPYGHYNWTSPSHHGSTSASAYHELANVLQGEISAAGLSIPKKIQLKVDASAARRFHEGISRNSRGANRSRNVANGPDLIEIPAEEEGHAGFPVHVRFWLDPKLAGRDRHPKGGDAGGGADVGREGDSVIAGAVAARAPNDYTREPLVSLHHGAEQHAGLADIVADEKGEGLGDIARVDEGGVSRVAGATEAGRGGNEGHGEVEAAGDEYEMRQFAPDQEMGHER
ncbi:uncharacterized protein SCHCODRAFT_02594751 [Schizophyllum commune H4-8]|nr:uncharacterized protein SCHCODRAFT_02594751 [Schizophyllum commune H4-8]KAI5884868.1 hypothetical protein SCHCODRAFT_02594751 [Schizophyllum commune H4-8]